MIRFLTTGQLATMAGVTRSWIQNLAASNRIPYDATIKDKDGAITYLFTLETAERLADQIKKQSKLPSRHRRKYE